MNAAALPGEIGRTYIIAQVKGLEARRKEDEGDGRSHST
jgi:hypothetical protein